jgi:glycosyltransferase involved in cell wall biosynthesis
MTADAVGGVWHYALELCRALCAQGTEVVLATMGPAPSAQQRADALALGNVILRESTFRLEWMQDPWTDVARAGEWLLSLADRFAVDLVHLNGYAHAVLPWGKPTVVVAHSCVLSWWRAVRGAPAPAEWDRYRTAVSAGLAAADTIAAPSRAMLNTLVENYGDARTRARLAAKSIVIPNARAPEVFSRPAEKEPFVLSVGRLWDEAKNARALVQVAAELPWPVRVAGDCTGPDGGTETLPGIECLGRCSPGALAHLYARAAIYALPARYEPFGLSVLEAALAGCALVLGDIPSLQENWHDVAVFVPPGEPAALRDAVRSLATNADRRHRLAAAARQRAARFSVERMAARYREAYVDATVAHGASATPLHPSPDSQPASAPDAPVLAASRLPALFA